MEAQKKQEEGNPTPEVMTALLDLARISHHVESAASENSAAIATMLLERLKVLCKAQYGALLLSAQHPVAAYDSFMFPDSSRVTYHTFALQNMNEEETHALITSLSENTAIQSPPENPCWLMCRLPISMTPWENQRSQDQLKDEREELGQRQDGSKITSLHPPTEPSRHIFLPMYALLVLGWEGNNEQACIEAMQEAQSVLPLVADVAGSVLASILLVERLHELETQANHKALREMELLKAELLATVSHELRSPLASVKGYAATLLRHERRISREERNEFLLAITQASDRLEAVIDRLLEISQLETGDITIHRSSVNLMYLIREAITSIERRLEVIEQEESPADSNRHYTFTLSLQDENGKPTREEPLIQADYHRLREVVDNLLENAIKFSPEGGPIEVVIRPVVASSQALISPIRAGKSEQDNTMGRHHLVPRVERMMEICVHDHGIGIPHVHFERIFDRFHQVDTRLTREVGGIGLGLAICRRIVELHGGMIWVESEIGKGSSFHVWLPMDEHT